QLAEEGHTEHAMRDSAAQTYGLRYLGIDVNRVVVATHVSVGVDLFLRHLLHQLRDWFALRHARRLCSGGSATGCSRCVSGRALTHDDRRLASDDSLAITGIAQLLDGHDGHAATRRLAQLGNAMLHREG